ncbi:MAG: GGDEF domain-containing protein [Deltaproteobacteria bacterium]|nr:GGDEF domain-containing protein [Deltaproteobacteria bacterium]
MAAGDNWDEDTTATDLPLSEQDALGASGRRACVTVLTGLATGQMYKIERGMTVIGRAPECSVRIVDDGISRNHARLRRDSGGAIVIEDQGSRNGTYVNGQRISAATALSEGDKIQIGRTTVLRFAYQDELDESFHENLLSSALRDPLTKLFNKRYLMDRLDSELKFARRHETSLSLLMIDIDHFKKLNDDHGHLAGDAVLAQLAHALARAVRNEDVVARFGGEELAIVLRAIPIEPAMGLGERLRRLVEQTVTNHQNKQLSATISIGVAGFPSTKAETVEQLIDAADKALYRAKRAGRNRVCQ